MRVILILPAFLLTVLLLSSLAQSSSTVATVDANNGFGGFAWADSGSGAYTYFDGTRYWVFYYDNSNIVYNSSTDGVTWSTGASTGSGTLLLSTTYNAVLSDFGIYGEVSFPEIISSPS